MSERNKLDNARRKGKTAARSKIPIEQNPMRAKDSRYYWEEAFREEMEKINNISVFSPGQDRHPENGTRILIDNNVISGARSGSAEWTGYFYFNQSRK